MIVDNCLPQDPEVRHLNGVVQVEELQAGEQRAENARNVQRFAERRASRDADPEPAVELIAPPMAFRLANK
jgi:hypothetical protein